MAKNIWRQIPDGRLTGDMLIKRQSSEQSWEIARQFFEADTGAAEITGASAVTLAGVTVSSAGTVGVAGASAITLAGVTVSSAGTVGVAGASAITLAGVTVSSAGTVGVAGASAITLAGVTAASAGAVEVTGASAITLAGVTAASAGAVEVTGASAITLAGVTAASAAVGGAAVVPADELPSGGGGAYKKKRLHKIPDMDGQQGKSLEDIFGAEARPVDAPEIQVDLSTSVSTTSPLANAVLARTIPAPQAKPVRHVPPPVAMEDDEDYDVYMVKLLVLAM